MNLQQLEYIIAVDKLHNFTRAAQQCHVTQATLSAMIKKLEEELDLVIFDRKCNPIVTTDEGKEIIEEAKRVLFHAHELRDKARQAKNIVAGSVSLGVIPTIANTLLPEILRPILYKFPDLQLIIHEFTTDDIIKKLEDGSLDAGIVATPLNKEAIEENILYYESMLVYGVNPLESDYVITDNLNDQKVWLLEEGHCFRNQTINVCNLKKSESLPENLIFEGNSFDTLLNIVDSFGGITLIPELYYNQMDPVRQKKSKAFDIPIPVREISLVYYRPFAKLRIINHLTDQISNLMKGKLMTEKFKNADLAIIGI